jgi:glycosyltransferase involved in cell wall biosynthesis
MSTKVYFFPNKTVRHMSEPISVVMPAYNSDRYIIEAIESIRKQTYKNFEFIIIDDGSIDQTFEIISSYEKMDGRIRGLSQENKGISRTLNRLIDEAKHEWVAIMHADDIALPKRLEKQITFAKLHPNLVACGSYAYHINENSKVLGLSKVGPTTEEEFHVRCRKGELIHLIHPTILLRKNAVIKVGGYNSVFDGSEELELLSRLLVLGQILTIAEPLMLYRIHSSSMTMQRFFHMSVFSRYVQACQRARADGNRPKTWDKFKYEYENAPVFSRFRRYIDDLSHFYYRKFAVMVSGERYLYAMTLFFLSALLNPKYAVLRAWNQRFSIEARSFLNARKVLVDWESNNDY